jgi:peptide-methionine (S)-S-oxide reductase
MARSLRVDRPPIQPGTAVSQIVLKRAANPPLRPQETAMPLFFKNKTQMPDPKSALPGRPEPIPTARTHFVNGAPLKGPYPEGSETAMFGLGCFWGSEKVFWRLPGVLVTAAGYSGGYTPNPTYEEVCTGQTGHNEVVRVVFDPKKISYAALLKAFWEAHDPTQRMRQGNDVGTQYRSGIYTYSDRQAEQARASKEAYQAELSARGYGAIATEIVPAREFFFAEDYHQQYLAKNPGGYCGHGGTGVSCPVGAGKAAE